jgi:tetratricopeptide (TPR) repeat protein
MVIIISIFIIVLFSLTAIITIHHIVSNSKPSSDTVERLIRKGKIDKAYSFSEKLDEKGVNQLVAKAKALIAISLKNQEDDLWKSFGTDPANWLDENSKKAVELLETALQIDSGASEVYCLLGVVQKEMGNFESAELNLRRAIHQNSTDPQCYLALASLFTLQEKITDAEQILIDASSRFSENLSVMKNLGYLYRYYLHKPESAIIWMNKYLTKTSSDDRSSGSVKQELRELLQRYPEYANVDTSAWVGGNRKFTQRKNTPFSR